MKDFNQWEEVAEWLERDEVVLVKDTWSFSKGYMTCYGGCCDDGFNSTAQCIECIKDYAGDSLGKVNKAQ